MKVIFSWKHVNLLMLVKKESKMKNKITKDSILIKLTNNNGEVEEILVRINKPFKTKDGRKFVINENFDMKEK
jgi:hypothetical protein